MIPMFLLVLFRDGIPNLHTQPPITPLPPSWLDTLLDVSDVVPLSNVYPHFYYITLGSPPYYFDDNNL